MNSPLVPKHARRPEKGKKRMVTGAKEASPCRIEGSTLDRFHLRILTLPRTGTGKPRPTTEAESHEWPWGRLEGRKAPALELGQGVGGQQPLSSASLK